MATNTFKSSVGKNVGTTASSVYTVPGATVSTLIGCSVANTTASQITTDVFITRSAVDYYLVKGASIPVGSSFVIVGGEQKIVLQAGDILKVVSSAASSIDVFVSYLETF